MSSAKAYVGRRDGDDIAHVEVEVSSDGQTKGYPLRHVVRHSPTGMEWGYGGSGPADLANSILADHLDMQGGVSQLLYQQFKTEVVARMPRDGWRLAGSRINEWLNQRWSHMDDTAIQADLSAGSVI